MIGSPGGSRGRRKSEADMTKTPCILEQSFLRQIMKFKKGENG